MTDKKSHPPMVSYVLITYNRKDDLIDCIESIHRQDYKNIEILLVDNSSTDGAAEVVEDCFPDVRIFTQDRNLGVPGARNVGFQHAKGDIIIVIDDDCIIRDEGLTDKVAERFQENDHVGVLAFRIVNYETQRVNSNEFPHRDKSRIDQRFETSYFVGAGHAIRRKVIDRAGLLYDAYFYALEELDYSWRVLEAGFRITYEPTLIVFHKATPVSRPSWRVVYFSVRNRIWFVYSFLPWYFITTHLLAWMPFFFFMAVRGNHLEVFFRGFLDGIRELPNLRNRRRDLKLSRSMRKKIRRLKGRLVC